MKKCNVLRSDETFMNAYLSEDLRILFDFCCEDVADDPYTIPAAVIDGQNYYFPKDAIDACSERAYVLLPFEVDRKWGYCDRWMGEVVHKPQWGWCSHFIPSANGQELARFNAAMDSPYDSERIKEEIFDPHSTEYNGRWGLLTVTGDVVIQPIFQYLSPIRKGVLLAKQNGLWGMIDIFGQVVIPLVHQDICFTEDDCVITCVTADGKKCFSMWSSTGVKLIDNLPAMPCLSDTSSWWENTFARYNKDPFDNELDANRVTVLRHCRWYKHNGTISVLRCIPGDDEHRPEVSHFGSACDNEDTAQCLIDTACESAGRILRDRAEKRRWLGTGEKENEKDSPLRARICRVRAEDKWGYYDLWSGEVIQKPEWSFFEPFYWNPWDSKDNYCIARFNVAPMSVECSGMDPSFQDTFEASTEDLNGRWGLIDYTGAILAPPIYQYLSPCVQNQYYIAKKDDLWGVLNRTGNIVIPLRYTGICWSMTYGVSFLLREGTEGNVQYHFLDDTLKVVLGNLSAMPEKTNPFKEYAAIEALCEECLLDPSLPKMDENEREYLCSSLLFWAFSCGYPELYHSRERMLEFACKELKKLRTKNHAQENEYHHVGTTGKPCRIYYAKCCGSIINQERYAVWYDGIPKWEFLDAILTEDGYIRVMERTPLIHQQSNRYVQPDEANTLGGTMEPYSFECDGQWGYCAGDGKILAYPVAGFCDGLPHINDSSFYVNDNMLMRFSLDSWTHFEIGEFHDSDQQGKKNERVSGRWGAFDCTGRLVIPPIYQYLGRSGQNNSLILAKKDGFWGALDGDGDEVVPFMWDDIWLDATYGCLARKNTRHGTRYAILDEEGAVLIGDLPSVPTHLDQYYDRSFQDGDKIRVLRCLLRYVHGEDHIRKGYKRYCTYAEAKEVMNSLFTADDEEIEGE